MDWLSSTIGFGFALSFYFVIHSVLAAKRIKALFPQQGYRLFYSILSIVGLGFLLYLLMCNPRTMLFSSSWLLKIIGLINIILGLWIIHLSTANYDSKAFLGLKPENYRDLKIAGLNKFVRHPMYYGNFHLFFGVILFYPSEKMMIFSLLSVCYIFVGTHFEERKLIHDFGIKYERYVQEVPMFFPFGSFGQFYKSLI